jgi:hypothetical protein
MLLVVSSAGFARGIKAAPFEKQGGILLNPQEKVRPLDISCI